MEADAEIPLDKAGDDLLKYYIAGYLDGDGIVAC